MKRRIYILLALFGLLLPVMNFAVPSTANAFDIFHSACSVDNDTNSNAGAGNAVVPSGSDVCKDQAAAGTSNPIVGTIKVAITILAFIIGIACTIVIILSGFRIVISQGDSQKVATARTAIIYALIGLVVAILAGTIVTLVLSNL